MFAGMVGRQMVSNICALDEGCLTCARKLLKGGGPFLLKPAAAGLCCSHGHGYNITQGTQELAGLLDLGAVCDGLLSQA
jgi:hypothetical protein